jgi:hypothetical protein
MRDHNPDFEAWLSTEHREAFTVSDESVGLYCIEDDEPMTGTGYVIISKARTS